MNQSITACTGYTVTLLTDFGALTYTMTDFTTFNLTLSAPGAHVLGLKVTNIFGVLFNQNLTTVGLHILLVVIDIVL
jgi:hypothetical protein